MSELVVTRDTARRSARATGCAIGVALLLTLAGGGALHDTKVKHHQFARISLRYAPGVTPICVLNTRQKCA